MNAVSERRDVTVRSQYVGRVARGLIPACNAAMALEGKGGAVSPKIMSRAWKPGSRISSREITAFRPSPTTQRHDLTPTPAAQDSAQSQGTSNPHRRHRLLPQEQSTQAATSIRARIPAKSSRVPSRARQPLEMEPAVARTLKASTP
jgi:hypothetical protein